MNPKAIKPVEFWWDYDLQEAILHRRGAGERIPDPEIRVWWFDNGYGVEAITSRELLMAGLVYYDVISGIAQDGKLVTMSEEMVRSFHLPEEVFLPREKQTSEEVENYLLTVKAYDTTRRKESSV